MGSNVGKVVNGNRRREVSTRMARGTAAKRRQCSGGDDRRRRLKKAPNTRVGRSGGVNGRKPRRKRGAEGERQAWNIMEQAQTYDEAVAPGNHTRMWGISPRTASKTPAGRVLRSKQRFGEAEDRHEQRLATEGRRDSGQTTQGAECQCPPGWASPKWLHRVRMFGSDVGCHQRVSEMHEGLLLSIRHINLRQTRHQGSVNRST